MAASSSTDKLLMDLVDDRPTKDAYNLALNWYTKRSSELDQHATNMDRNMLRVSWMSMTVVDIADMRPRIGIGREQPDTPLLVVNAAEILRDHGHYCGNLVFVDSKIGRVYGWISGRFIELKTAENPQKRLFVPKVADMNIDLLLVDQPNQLFRDVVGDASTIAYNSRKARLSTLYASKQDMERDTDNNESSDAVLVTEKLHARNCFLLKVYDLLNKYGLTLKPPSAMPTQRPLRIDEKLRLFIDLNNLMLSNRHSESFLWANAHLRYSTAILLSMLPGDEMANQIILADAKLLELVIESHLLTEQESGLVNSHSVTALLEKYGIRRVEHHIFPRVLTYSNLCALFPKEETRGSLIALRRHCRARLAQLMISERSLHANNLEPLAAKLLATHELMRPTAPLPCNWYVFDRWEVCPEMILKSRHSTSEWCGSSYCDVPGHTDVPIQYYAVVEHNKNPQKNYMRRVETMEEIRKAGLKTPEVTIYDNRAIISDCRPLCATSMIGVGGSAMIGGGKMIASIYDIPAVVSSLIYQFGKMSIQKARLAFSTNYATRVWPNVCFSLPNRKIYRERLRPLAKPKTTSSEIECVINEILAGGSRLERMLGYGVECFWNEAKNLQVVMDEILKKRESITVPCLPPSEQTFIDSYDKLCQFSHRYFPPCIQILITKPAEHVKHEHLKNDERLSLVNFLYTAKFTREQTERILYMVMSASSDYKQSWPTLSEFLHHKKYGTVVAQLYRQRSQPGRGRGYTCESFRKIGICPADRIDVKAHYGYWRGQVIDMEDLQKEPKRELRCAKLLYPHSSTNYPITCPLKWYTGRLKQASKQFSPMRSLPSTQVNTIPTSTTTTTEACSSSNDIIMMGDMDSTM